MTVQTVNANTSCEAALRILRTDGCIIIRELASRSTMDAIAGELEPYFAETPNGEGYFVGYRTQRMGGLIVKSPSSRPLITHPLVRGIVDAVLGAFCSSHQLNLTQAIRIRPGEAPQVFHKDDELFPFPHDNLECMMNAIWAYDDFTAENGATRLVPGSHLEPVSRMPAEDRVCQAVMPRGSVLIYLGSTLHSGGANRSNRGRTGLTFSYSLGWLRQAENQYLAVPPDVARTLSKDLQALAGYSIHAPNLGWYEGQDPSVVLDTGAPSTLAARDYMPAHLVAQLREYHDAHQAAMT